LDDTDQSGDEWRTASHAVDVAISLDHFHGTEEDILNFAIAWRQPNDRE
jgi:hypothetical protein